MFEVRLEQFWPSTDFLVATSELYGSKSSRGVLRELRRTSGTQFPDKLARSVKDSNKFGNFKKKNRLASWEKRPAGRTLGVMVNTDLVKCSLSGLLLAAASVCYARELLLAAASFCCVRGRVLYS